jgi:acetyl-CoA acetyltransferase
MVVLVLWSSCWFYGSRIILTLIHALKRTGGKKGVAQLSIQVVVKQYVVAIELISTLIT